MQDRSNRLSHHGTTLAGCTALLLLALDQTRASTVEADETGSASHPFAVLWEGTDEERLADAEDCDSLAGEAFALTPDSREVVDRLLAVLDAEPDPWIRFSCLHSLAENSSNSGLDPLFVKILDDGRPGDLWPAVGWFSERRAPDALPHLQDLWPARKRPWLQPLLVLALGNHGSMEHLEEFLRLAQNDEPDRRDLAGAAIVALGILEDEAALPVVIRLSSGNGPLATRSIETLARWPESARAREQLLRLLAGGRPGQRTAALDALDAFDHPDVLEARLRLVEDGLAGIDLRISAIEGLSAEDHPSVFPVLRAVVTGDSADSEALSQAAWQVLRFNAQVVDDDALIRFVSQPRPPQGHVVFTTSGCSFVGSSPTRLAPALRVTPDSGRSLRCWAGPGRIVPWQDELTERIPAGFPMLHQAVFEGPDGVLALNPFQSCWLPMEQLAWRPLEPEESELPFFWNSPLESDFDIPLSESDSDTALLLQDAGLLELFDPGPGTIGAALVLDEYRPELRDLLLHLSEAGDAPLLQDALEAALEDLEEEIEETR